MWRWFALSPWPLAHENLIGVGTNHRLFSYGDRVELTKRDRALARLEVILRPSFSSVTNIYFSIRY